MLFYLAHLNSFIPGDIVHITLRRMQGVKRVSSVLENDMLTYTVILIIVKNYHHRHECIVSYVFIFTDS